MSDIANIFLSVSMVILIASLIFLAYIRKINFHGTPVKF